MSEQEQPKPDNGGENLPNGGRPYLVISILEDEKVSITGSIGNKLIAYGLLATAHDEIAEFHKKLNQPKIVQGGLMNFVRGKRH